jgi:hypothetical protein
LDILYFQNELDFGTLERDFVAEFYQYEDFQHFLGPRGDNRALLKPGISLPRIAILNDFNKARYEKARREGTLDQFIADEQYGKDMKAAILFAKGDEKFGEFDGAKFFKYMQSHPDLMKKYFDNNPGKRDEWMKSTAYFNGMQAAARAARAGGGGWDGSAWFKYMKDHPKLLRQYFDRHRGKEAEWARNTAYIKYIGRWGALVGAGKWDAANDVWGTLPQWVKDKYYAKYPERRQKAAQTAQYLGMMKKWVGLFDTGEKGEAMEYFNSLPKWAKERYYAKHPEKRTEYETNAVMWAKLAKYFTADDANKTEYLKANPDLQRFLAKNATSQSRQLALVMQAYRAIPKEEAWLRRVFREQHPEVFSQAEISKRKLESVYGQLVRHPEMGDGFDKWLAVIQKSYIDMLQHQPRPKSSYITTDRRVPARHFAKSYSAEEASR